MTRNLSQRFLYWLLCLFLLLPVIGVAARESKSCKEVEIISAKIRSWAALSSAHARFPNCDDGAIAEGFDESTYNLLTKSTQAELIFLEKLIQKKATFGVFVLKHAAGETLLPEQYEAAAARLAQICSSGSPAICADLISAVSKAKAVSKQSPSTSQK